MEVSTKNKTHIAERRFPIGAEVLANGGVLFRVWAPKCRRVMLVLEGDSTSGVSEQLTYRLKTEGNGYFSLLRANAKADMRYGFRLDNRNQIFSDPASRFQPDGTQGLSQIVDPHQFRWSDANWRGLKPQGQVVYELHIGTFTPEGTYAAAANKLAELARIGITTIEVMPLAEFPGNFGWGYDGVLMFSPTRLYGTPDDLRRFVDRAHSVGLGVILDVVYNHFGNVDNYLGEFTDHVKSHKYKNEWGEAINFDDENSPSVREFFQTNAQYWIDEFHLDGFRFDATQQIFDASDQHILADIGRAVKAVVNTKHGGSNLPNPETHSPSRRIYLVAENEPEDVVLVKPVKSGGYGLDALWNDDFHHSAHVRLTGNNPAYYSDFLGKMEEMTAAIKQGFIYQGQFSSWQKKRRGTPTDGVPAWAFVSFLENHDQVANSATGQRLHQLASPGAYRAMTALWLLMPQTPMFFQGQEFASSKPFLFFADYSGDMGKAVVNGRAKFLSQFPQLAGSKAAKTLPNPTDPDVFRRCKLDFAERQTNAAAYRLHIDLLKMRRDDLIFRRQTFDDLSTAVLSPDCLAVRFAGSDASERLLVVNFGGELELTPVAEPLLAAPADAKWHVHWHSNQSEYGGSGANLIENQIGWKIGAEVAVVLHAANSPSDGH